MSVLNEISLWLKNNDVAIKVLATIAAPGGIWFWIDKFRNRIRIKIRKLGMPLGDTSLRGIAIEVENISSTLTSFEPKFTLIGYSPEHKKQIYTFTFDCVDRQLPSHVSKQFHGWHNDTENRIMLFLKFMTFNFPLSRGRCVRYRVQSSDFKPIGYFRFHWRRLLFLWFGKVPE